MKLEAITPKRMSRIIFEASFASETEALYSKLKIIKGNTKIIADLIVRLRAKRLIAMFLGIKLPKEIIATIKIARIMGICRNIGVIIVN